MVKSSSEILPWSRSTMNKKVRLLMLVLQMLTREKFRNLLRQKQGDEKQGDECEPQVPGVCQETLRWSTRQVRRPSRFKDFVLSLTD